MGALGERCVVVVSWYEFGDGVTVTCETYVGTERTGALVHAPVEPGRDDLVDLAIRAHGLAFPKLFP